MVVRITTPHTLKATLRYHENKVARGTARCLYAHGYLQGADRLSLNDKQKRLEQRMALRPHVRTGVVHISLNFHPGEKLEPETLIALARGYMEGIGFGSQPYLVYEHRDAGHPHLHLVTTSIQRDGRRISLHNLGRGRSDETRKALEARFGLYRATSSPKKLTRGEAPPTKAAYGRCETVQALRSVLQWVLPRYQYTSLSELNAVLRLFGVAANAGGRGSALQQKGGLLYHLVDSEGRSKGVPQKASSFPFAATAAFLQKQFLLNRNLRQKHRTALTSTLDQVLASRPGSLEAFSRQLKSKSVTATVMKTGEGLLRGITFIDHQRYSVFGGGDLGERYHIGALVSRLYAQRRISGGWTTHWLAPPLQPPKVDAPDRGRYDRPSFTHSSPGEPLPHLDRTYAKRRIKKKAARKQ